jgi:hypothetical protein
MFLSPDWSIPLISAIIDLKGGWGEGFDKGLLLSVNERKRLFIF